MLVTYRGLLVVAASTSMLACSASMRRGVTPTDAATAMQQVTRSRFDERDPAVSPDGTMVAFETTPSPGAAPHVEAMALKDAGAERAPRVTYGPPDLGGREPAWIPDGSGLVFLSGSAGSDRLVRAVGSTFTSPGVLADAGNRLLAGTWPAISPDGSLAMSIPRLGLFHSGWQRGVTYDAAIGVSDLSGSGLTVLGEGTGPAWSPHGHRLAFARMSGGHNHVFVANADGSSAVQITDGPADDVEPAWSPDGGALAFCSGQVAGDGTTHSNIFVVNPDGSGLQQLTEGDRSACRPDWARDGFIYFHADATDRFHIWRIRRLDD